ncbi:transglutaminase domain-containing protein [Deminuibacter soli]|uniref:Transglutaminase-like domain-containing protein n=1 Tax=Deminuibacter soli TaxID=2291815 RepID=A0A3E1NHY9_9BACT|nr:transglutaminase domain-containing protein [Deminuibacter soli]RFM27471.1 hypothetical protein DXN05_15765 [Deminuibacter soli]
MKWSLPVLLCLTCLTVHAQRHTHKHDAAVALTPALLAAEVTAGDSTDRQKVNSIMQWIAANIAYNLRTNLRATYTDNKETPADTGSLKPLNDRVAEMVLQRGMAVCEGYARLFASLCNYAGVQSELVRGYAKTGRNRFFRSNHTWNAVLIDSSWYLLDPTWASGYINYRNEFEPHFDDTYFLASPRAFLMDHYPEDLRWTLLAEPPALKEFDRSPFCTTAFVQMHVQSVFPSTGTLYARPGDTLYFNIHTLDTLHGSLYATDRVLLLPDSIANTDSSIHTTTLATGTNILHTSYVVPTSGDAQWLNLIFRDAVVLRYRLRIKPAATLADQSAVRQ